MTVQLGRLESVEARVVWNDEARDFTPWLHRNADVLSTLVGLDLVFDAAEYPVGTFRLDLLGHLESSPDDILVVENQLGISDHSHLGQVVTYAAGTNASTIIWIAGQFKEEHRSAVRWLNDHTHEGIRVFAISVKAVKIADSPYAPHLEVVAGPNDWEKNLRKAAKEVTEPTGKALLYGEFWEQFLTAARATGASWVPSGSTTYDSWCDTRTDVPNTVLSMAFRRQGLTLELYFNSSQSTINSARYAALETRRADLDHMMGDAPIWDPMTGNKAARVVVPSTFADVADREQWPAINQWLLTTQNTFRDALRNIDVSSLLTGSGAHHGG